jgi:hypothetical protein
MLMDVWEQGDEEGLRKKQGKEENYKILSLAISDRHSILSRTVKSRTLEDCVHAARI